MKPVMTIQQFAAGLSAIPEDEFTHQEVLEYLRASPVDAASLDRYLYFNPQHYTRNLIHHTPLFDLLAICWEPGQTSAIHNHRNQSCWMAIAYGQVKVQNFRLLRRDPVTQYCELEPSTQYVIDTSRPAGVDPEEPIHLVANPASFGSRAVTLHIYSRPFDTCEVYDLKSRRYQEVALVNTSEFGVLKSGAQAEKAALA